MSSHDKKSPKHSPDAPSAYDRILDRLRERLDKAGENSWDFIQQQIEEAAEIELAAEEMTRDEMDLLKAYIRRDLVQLGYYIHETGAGVASWLHFDLDVLERTAMDRLLDLADRTRVGLELLREQLDHGENEYIAGEITIPGTLECAICGEAQCLTSTSVIEPCGCGSVVFLRRTDTADQQASQQQ
ncbi:zinc ribbon-containing protein [Marinobacterium mangrovicola]|uniref:Zinc ribbon family protein n=1 Tax=Marinobacterium mangrovicola TaxID=1476959 RepID=A0A4R1GQX4_9GAMM|nr:metalloendopeptidase [Marinobacterium mangrovicola]TCK06892.1 zinc ribbon family protein [Marinobacterium mangrovicola]